MTPAVTRDSAVAAILHASGSVVRERQAVRMLVQARIVEPPLRGKLRALLRDAPDGLTTAALSAATGVAKSGISRTLGAMPDVYIDRWELAARTGSPYAAVWCAVVPPPNCPRPDQ